MKSGKKDPLPPPEPPAGLSEQAAETWRKVVTWPEDRISAGRLEALRQAFVLRDDCEKLRSTIEREGMTKESARSGLSHRHPLLDSYFRLQKELRKSWRDLGLSDNQGIGGQNW